MLSVNEEVVDDRPLTQDELLQHFFSSDLSTFQNYAILTRQNHQQPVKVTWNEVAKSFFPVCTSYGIGAAASESYIGAAQKAARDVVSYYLNPTVAVILNAMGHGYFFNLVISPKWEEAITQLFGLRSKEEENAILDLQNLAPGYLAKAGRGLKNLLLSTAVFATAFVSAYPSFALSENVSGDSHPIALMVLLCATMLQYNGIESFLYKYMQALFYDPFHYLYRKINNEAMNNYKIQQTLMALKDAHKAGLISAQSEILTMLQSDQQGQLDEIYSLLVNENPSRIEAIELLLKVLSLAKNNAHQPSAIGCRMTQLISLVFAIVSCIGWGAITLESFSDYAEKHLNITETTELVLASIIIVISDALPLDVAWIVGKDIYDLISNAAHVIKEAYAATPSILDFLKKAWSNKGDAASWHALLQSSLAIQQNPRTMIGVTTFLFALSFWSTQTSTYLNEQCLPKISKQIELITIIAIMLFNTFPVPIIIASVQRFLKRLFGDDLSLKQIQLLQFIENQLKTIDEIDNSKFLTLLNEMIESTNEHQATEAFFTTFFGNKTPSDIFEAQSNYGTKQYNEIIPCMVNQDMAALSRIGFFPIADNGNRLSAILFDEEANHLVQVSDQPLQQYGSSYLKRPVKLTQEFVRPGGSRQGLSAI